VSDYWPWVSIGLLTVLVSAILYFLSAIRESREQVKTLIGFVNEYQEIVDKGIVLYDSMCETSNMWKSIALKQARIAYKETHRMDNDEH